MHIATRRLRSLICESARPRMRSAASSAVSSAVRARGARHAAQELHRAPLVRTRALGRPTYPDAIAYSARGAMASAAAPCPPSNRPSATARATAHARGRGVRQLAQRPRRDCRLGHAMEAVRGDGLLSQDPTRIRAHPPPPLVRRPRPLTGRTAPPAAAVGRWGMMCRSWPIGPPARSCNHRGSRASAG